jgi:nucleoside-diphosphate-sugar epimerase
MKRALITGGCGFIGSNLAKSLVKENWIVDIVDDMSGGNLDSLKGLQLRVLPNSSFLPVYSQDSQRILDKKNVLVIQDDFASKGMLNHIQKNHYDVIFHQAAIPRVSYSVEHPDETTYTNIYSTICLFKSATNHVKRIVWASSSSVYGGADSLPTSESERGKNLPKSPYAWQKFVIEDYATMAADLYNLDIVCLRYFNVFGPGQLGNSPYSTAVAAWCHATKQGLSLRSDGDGNQTRDMCYIDNVVNANILAANSNISFNGRAYNIACGERVSNNEILDYFKSNFNIDIEHAPERAGDVKHTLADISRAKEELNYEPKVLFWDGLEKTIEWWDIR